MEKANQYRFWFILIFLSVFQVRVTFGVTSKINVLLINSYNQGYAWTDSLTSGILKEFKEHPEINFYIKNLNSKRFGQSRFEIEKDYLKQVYQGVSFAGVIVTDNDALDFAQRYDRELFPNVPIVFAGISNPEEYPLEGSNYYGIKETGDSYQVLDLIRKLLPDSKNLFVIVDKTTTGLIARREFNSDKKKFKGLDVTFPDIIDLESIYKQVESKNNFDAIYYSSIGQDQNGQLIDPLTPIYRISELATVPVFINDPVNKCSGILGGLFRNGVQQGKVAVDLLLQLINSASREGIKHINQTKPHFYFDRKVLDKYKIPVKRLPANSRVFNQHTLFSRENFTILLVVLFLLSIASIVLSVVNIRRRADQQRSKRELREIEIQKEELESAYDKLAVMMAKVEDTNWRLNDLNEKLLVAKKKAEESDQLKSAFLANVSHEIRTPLNSIVGFSSLLIDDELGPDLRGKYVDLIESNTSSLLVLIDEIIDLSKIEAQQLTLKKRDFNVDYLIEELFQIFSLNKKNNDVQLVVKKTDDARNLFIFSDLVRVKQIFINLLSNAFKFTDSGVIEFGYFISKNNELTFYVKDSGIGIEKEHHQAIFQRFRKLNEGNDKRLYRGTGLGLAITQKLVELLGGRIWIESEPGIGSVFYFTLEGAELRDKNL